MAFGNRAAATTQTQAKPSLAKGRSSLSAVMGQATMGSQRLPNIPLGLGRLEVVDTFQANRSATLVVVFKIHKSEQDGKVGTKCSKAFKFGGESEGQPEARAAEWTRFVCSIAGKNLDELEAMAEESDEPVHPNDILEASTYADGEAHAKPLVGAIVDVDCVDSGKLTKPKGKYKGGDHIHDHYWSYVPDEAVAA
jgi:hypothetical protein